MARAVPVSRSPKNLYGPTLRKMTVYLARMIFFYYVMLHSRQSAKRDKANRCISQEQKSSAVLLWRGPCLHQS